MQELFLKVAHHQDLRQKVYNMRLNEFYNPEFDDFQKADAEKRRKPKLTLEQINKLRKVRAIKRAEDIEHKKFVSVMYQAPTDAGAGGGLI